MSPVIIIGAPRSGTNLVRDVLTSIDGIATWPCDEINYIWRHGNARHPSDEFPAEFARPEVIRYIRGKFRSLARARSASVLVEKTCANSLRVPFVHQVIPSAKFIYIYRNGIDAAASAKIRWRASLEIPYVLRKARYVPVTDLPYYGSNYFLNRVYRLFSSEQRLSSWGPRIDDMGELVKHHDLIEVCGIQWQRCVENAERAFERMHGEQLLRVNYDQFVRKPFAEMTRIMEFIGYHTSPVAIDRSVRAVTTNSLGRGNSTLSDDEILRLRNIIGSTLDRHDDR